MGSRPDRSDTGVAELAITQLRKGGILLKFCRRAPPHFVNIRLSFDDSELIYNSIGNLSHKHKPKKCIDVLRIADVESGASSSLWNYLGSNHQQLYNCSFTVVYFNRREILRRLTFAWCVERPERTVRTQARIRVRKHARPQATARLTPPPHAQHERPRAQPVDMRHQRGAAPPDRPGLAQRAPPCARPERLARAV